MPVTHLFHIVLMKSAAVLPHAGAGFEMVAFHALTSKIAVRSCTTRLARIALAFIFEAVSANDESVCLGRVRGCSTL